MASRTNTLSTIKSTSLLSHGYLNITWSSSVMMSIICLFKVYWQRRHILLLGVVTKSFCNLPSYSSWSNKGYCLYQLCFAKHIHRDTKWAKSVPQACSDGKLDNLQVWSGKITAQIWPPGWQRTLMHEVQHTSKNCEQLLNPFAVV